MRTSTFWKRVAIVFALGVAISGAPAYTATSKATADAPALLESSAQPPDAVTVWNREAVRVLFLQSPLPAPARQTRLMAIVQVAVHDAVNGITRQYATYLPPQPPPADASPVAAAISAAHHALVTLFDGQDQQLDDLFEQTLADHGLTEDDPGIAYGQAAAAAILALRSNDGSAQAQFTYVPPGAGLPGVWVPLPNQTAVLAGWGSVTPWVMRSGSQFRPDSPPALDSEQYAIDYNEIKLIGASNSPTRTTEQTRIAQFWVASPVQIWNPVLNQVLAARDLDLSATARAFAIFYLAAADASVACWDAKYTYNYWRPQAAIRRGDEDGNDSTAADPTWAPLNGTPAHPEYPSGHTANSSAMAEVLGLLFGDEPGAQIVVTIGPTTRQWGSFSEGVEEVIDARVYSGIHFRTADEVGGRQGRQVARFVWTHALRPCRRGGSRCR